MKYLTKYFFLLPLLFIVFEFVYFTTQNAGPKLSPNSDSNKYLTDLIDTLRISGLNYQQLNFFDHRNEAELVVITRPDRSFKTVFSTKKSPLYQVAALQKLIKIANIEGRELSFVDFSSPRPYATF